MRTASPRTLERLLRSPARRLVLDTIFWHTARQLRRTGSSRPDSTIRCYVIGDASGEPDAYELCFSNRSCRVVRGVGDAKPHVTIALDDAELVKLVSGQVSPAQEVLNGRVMVRGALGPLANTLASMLLSQPRE